MKNIIRIFLFITIMITTISCEGGNTSTTPEAEAAVKEALDAYQAQNYDDFYKMLTEIPSELDFTNSKKTEAVIRSHSNFTYTIKSAKKGKENATVKVEITAIDLQALLQKYVTQIINEQINNPGASEAANQEKANEIFDTLVNASDVVKKTKTIEVEVVNQNGAWQLVPNLNFADALTGFQKDSKS